MNHHIMSLRSLLSARRYTAKFTSAADPWTTINVKRSTLLKADEALTAIADQLWNALIITEREVWQPMVIAPRDGTILRLLVDFTENATEDSSEPCATIGANNFDHDQIDEWKFAGWNWSHDCFTEGKGTPVGWFPLLPAAPAPEQKMRETE